MTETFFLSSMDSATFSSVHRCEVVERLELPNGHHALLVTCDPPVPGQELGHPLGIDRLLLWSRFEGDDLWTFPTFPHFVQVCLPDVPLHPTRMPASIAWGEVYATAADASAHEMDARPRTTAVGGSARAAQSVPGSRRELALAGETLDLVEVDPTGATTMRFSNDALVRFERDFAVGTHDGTESFVLRSDLATVLPALRLLHDEVVHATVSAARLDVAFRSGASLSGWADRSAASWRFRDPGRPALEVDVLAGGTVDVREHRPPAGDVLPWGRPVPAADEFVWDTGGRREEHDVEVPGTGVRLRLVGAVVERCTFGHATTLTCSNGSTLVFETPLMVGADGTASTVDPGSPGTLGPLLLLHGRQITGARVEDDRLVLALADGVTVEAPTDPHHESWHYAGPDPTGSVVVGMPGGGLAWW